MKISIHEKIVILSLIVLSVNGFIGYSVYKSNRDLRSSQKWVVHTDLVMSRSSAILSDAKDMQTALRGFTLTNDSAFLAPMWSAVKVTSSSITALRQLVQDNPVQLQRVDSLAAYLHKLQVYALQAIDIRSTKGLNAGIAHIATKQGNQYTDQIRVITAAILQEEGMLLKQRLHINSEKVLVLNTYSVAMFILMMVFTVFLLIITGGYMYQNKQKIKRANELLIANKELLFQNEEKEKRASELSIANMELVFQNNEKAKRAAELMIANEELVFQNGEKAKRAAELLVANEELVYQNEEKAKRAAELVIANKDLLASQEIANYGNFEMDYKTGITFWSEQLCNILGFAPGNNRQPFRSLLRLVHPDDIDNVVKNTKRAARGSNVNFYHRIVRNDDTTRYIHTWQRVEFDTNGKPVSMHIVAHDITDQTANVVQLEMQNKQLRDIAWLQSHKVRGPLASILGLAYLFNDESCTSNHQEIIAGIVTASQKLDMVIAQIVNKTTAADISERTLGTS